MMKDKLGDRMKKYYEETSKTRLLRRTPVIVRLDGRAFHTFTRGFKKPFDDLFMRAMQDTMKYLCTHIQGCVLGYAQSDEITLVLIDYAKLTTSAWFDYEIQKICSITAAMATLEFNRRFNDYVIEWMEDFAFKPSLADEDENLYKTYRRACETGAVFDARCFNVPREEVVNCIYWRQIDAERNSVSAVAQSVFSAQEIYKVNIRDTIIKLEQEKGIIWGNFPTSQKRGSCCIKTDSGWVIDNNIPRFINEGRDYIEKLIDISTEEEV